MIRLDATTKTLSLIATGTADVQVSGLYELTGGGFNEETKATASTQTISAAPVSGDVKHEDHITIQNTSGGSANYTVQIVNSSGPVTTHSMYAVLADKETLEYTNEGWKTLDASGQQKITVGGAAGNFAVGGNLTVAGTSVFTGLGTFNAGISIPTGQNVTGAGTAQVTGFATVSATALAGTLSTAAQPNVTSVGTLTGLSISSGAAALPMSVTNSVAGNTGIILNNTAVDSGNRNWAIALNQAVYGDMHFLVGTAANAVPSVSKFNITSAGNATFAGSLTAGAISTTATSGTGTAVIIDGSSILRPLTSSERFKTITEPNWQPSDAQITAFLAVSPMVSHYIDNDFGPMEGFSAERLAAVDPLLVNWDAEGKPYSLREHAILAYQHAIIAKLYKELH